MIIDDSNYSLGNKAMAAVLLLYYHLLKESGITNDQTIYIDSIDFDPFQYLDVTVTEKNCTFDINKKLLREGAIIHLVCDLNDMITEYSDSYLQQEITINIITEFKKGNMISIPEITELIKVINVKETDLDYKSYSLLLEKIYNKYVVDFFSGLIK